MSDAPTGSLAPGDEPAATRGHDGAGSRAGSGTDDATMGPAEALTDVGPPVAPPGYELLEEIGRGGMGVVYRAREVALNRGVALKMLRDRYPADSVAATRFVEEALITGQLQHPGIPPIHQVGTLSDGRPFLAMKLIKGQTLEVLLNERTSPADDRGRFLAVFEQVCQAVACAHGHRVIHRDLKPANVMVGAFGEVQVMDWGLAKTLNTTAPTEIIEPRDRPVQTATEIRTLRDSDGSFTQAGSIMGTPAYMPPEQAGGEVERIDERSDVFGLGAILCVILTGQPPYTGRDSDSVRLKAIRGQLEECQARLDACGAEPELVALAKRCLEADPADRPRNADEVATAVANLRAAADERARQAELERVRTEGELRAAEVRTAEQRKRRRAQAALGLAFTALVMLGGAFAWWMDRQAAERKAERQRDETEKRAALEREVNQSVEGAVAKYGRATGAGRDLALWAEARAAALQAEARAVEADASPQVRDRIRQLVAEIDHVEKNRRLIATLLEIYAGMGDDMTDTADMDFAGADARYTRAFREYGTDLLAMTPEAGAELLRTLGGDVRVELAAAIDDWGYVRFAQWMLHLRKAAGPHDTELLLRVTQLLDPDPVRNRVRSIVTKRDHTELNQLAEEIDPAVQPVQTVNLIAVYLYWFRGTRGVDASIRFGERAYPHHPDDFQIMFNLGFWYLTQRRWAESLPYCTAALAARPRSAIAWKNYAVALAGLGQQSKAADAYLRICTLMPKNTFGRRQLLHLVSQMGDRKEANAFLGRLVTIYRDALQRDSMDAAIHGNLGCTLLAMDDLDGAIAASKESVRLDRKSVETHYCLWNALVKRNTLQGKADHEPALAAFKEMTQLDPQDAWPHFQMGRLLETWNDHKGAVPCYRDAIRLDPGFSPAHRALGDLLLGQEDYDGAVACFRVAAALEPNDTWPHTKLGLALAGKHDWDGAIAAYREANRANPDYGSSYYHLGDALRGKGYLNGAIAAYQKANRLDPSDQRPLRSLGHILTLTGHLEEAISAYRDLIKLAPMDVLAHNNLAWILSSGPEGVRDGKRAVEHATRACELTGWMDPGKLDTLAAAYAEHGDFDRAIEYQKKALASPEFPKADVAGARQRLDLYTHKKPFREPAFLRRELAPPPRTVKR